jgi:hypothetical protein
VYWRFVGTSLSLNYAQYFGDLECVIVTVIHRYCIRVTRRVDSLLVMVVSLSSNTFIDLLAVSGGRTACIGLLEGVVAFAVAAVFSAGCDGRVFLCERLVGCLLSHCAIVCQLLSGVVL